MAIARSCAACGPMTGPLYLGLADPNGVKGHKSSCFLADM